MPMSTRELYLVLRARDEASRTLRGLSRELLSTGSAAAAASSRVQAGIARETAARARREAQMARDLAARQRQIAAALRERAVIARMTGATTAQINHYRLQAIAADRAARVQENVARAHDRSARAALAQAQAMDQNARAADEVNQRHRHMISIVEQSGTAMATAGVGLVAVGVVGLAAMKNLVDVSIEYERQVRHTATQIDGFKGNLQEIGDIGRRLARDIAVPFEKIQPALFDIFSSTEASVQEAEVLLRAFAKAAVAGQVEIQYASRATIGLLNAFSLPLTDVNRVLDIQFQLVKEGVGSYAEWSDKIGLVSPSAARAGQSIEVMTAALATATRMGMTAARASTSVARAFDAMSNPKVIEKLSKMGISALDASGRMRPLNEVLRDLRTAIMKLPEKDRVAALLDVFKGAGSTIEARRFLQTMLLVPGTLEQFDQILGNITNSTGSLDAAYGSMADSAAAKTELLRNKWMLLKEGLGTALTPSFIKVVDAISSVLDRFDKLSQKSKNMVAMALVFGAAVTLLGGAILVVVGGLAAFIAAVAAAGSVLLPVIGIVIGVVAVLGLLGAAFISAYKGSGGFKTFIDGAVTGLKELKKIASDLGSSISASWNTHVAPAFAKLRSYINEWVMPALTTFRNEIQGQFLSSLRSVAATVSGVVEKAFSLLGAAINNWVLPAVKYLTEAWLQNREKLMPLIQVLIQVLGWFGKIGAIVGGVLVVVLGGALLATIGMVVSAIGILIRIIGACISAWQSTVGAIRAVITTMGMLNSGARQHIGNFLSLVGGIPGRIQNAIGSMGSLLYNAGVSLIQGLINGIEAKIGNLIATVSRIAGIIAQHKGPIEKDKRLLIPAGIAIMSGLVKGIKQAMPMLNAQINDVNGQLQVSGGADDGTFRRPDIPPPPPSTPAVKNYYITQNITTQEINPVRQAAALGWEVQTVM